MRITWAADVLRAAGVPVVEMPGWQTRGSAQWSIHGLVWHHTVTGPTWSNQRVRNLLRDGRPDLRGPLSQFGLERDGTWVCVASGRANHNGYGQWGNDSIGIEAYNDGVSEPWRGVQVESWHTGTAALLRHLRLGPDAVKAHRETDPRRKIDPHSIDMDGVRNRLADLLIPIPTEESDTMVIQHPGGDWHMLVTPLGVFAGTAKSFRPGKVDVVATADGWKAMVDRFDAAKQLTRIG